MPNFEEKELEHRLCLKVSLLDNSLVYNEESARMEARGVVENRKQNVIINLSKVRNFLTAAREEEMLPLDLARPPLQPLNQSETEGYLWNADTSIAAQMLDAALKKAKNVRPEAQAEFAAMKMRRESEQLHGIDAVRKALRGLARSALETAWCCLHRGWRSHHLGHVY